MTIIPIHIKYANIECPRCSAEVTQPCRADTGYNYDFRYTHAIRRELWWWRERQRGWREQQRGEANPKSGMVLDLESPHSYWNEQT